MGPAGFMLIVSRPSGSPRKRLGPLGGGVQGWAAGRRADGCTHLQEEQHLAGSMGGHSKSGVNMVGMETGTDMVCVCRYVYEYMCIYMSVGE